VKLRSILIAIVVFGLLALLSRPARAATTPVSSLEWATQVLEEVLTIPQGGIPRSVLDQAKAVAVFPNATRSDLSGGGQVAEGIIVARNSDGTWTNPALISLRESASESEQAGLTNDLILLFRTSEGISALENAPLTLGSGVTVEGGPLGDIDKGGIHKPDTNGQAQVYSYSIARGELVGLVPKGAVLQFERAANEELYGKKDIALGEIFTSKSIDVPVVAGKLKCTLAMHTNFKQMCG